MGFKRSQYIAIENEISKKFLKRSDDEALRVGSNEELILCPHKRNSAI